jgi:putative membrane protein
VAAAWAAGGAGIAAQMVFPFTGGGTLALTVASVVLLATASVLHVAATRGAGAVGALVLVAGAGGLAAEAVGVRTDVPFGAYSYNGTLGPHVLGVPAVVPLAWLMMAWPALVVARHLVGRHPVAVPFVAAFALTSWDVFLDPQMVDAGHWSWQHPTPSLPGVSDVPLTNFAGWLVVSLVMSTLLDRLVGPPRNGSGAAPDALPLTIFLWTYASSVLAHAVFFGRPSVALVGGVVMGVVAVPLAVYLWREGSWRDRTTGVGA